MRSFVFLNRSSNGCSSNSGCLLALLIFFNLFFGWIFLKIKYWLFLEAILVLIFLVSGYITMRKITSFSSRRDNAVDVKGEVIEDKDKLK